MPKKSKVEGEEKIFVKDVGWYYRGDILKNAEKELSKKDREIAKLRDMLVWERASCLAQKHNEPAHYYREEAGIQIEKELKGGK